MPEFQIERAKLIWEPLDTEKHDVMGFSCEKGEESFSNYLKSKATKDQANGITQTHVLSHEEIVVGYYCVRCSKIRIDFTEANFLYGRSDRIAVPAIEVPFLAVDAKFRNQKWGQIILNEIISHSYEIAQNIGCRYVFIQAVEKEWLLSWYQKNGFEYTPFTGEPEDGWTKPMRYLIPQLRMLPVEEDFEEEAGI